MTRPSGYIADRYVDVYLRNGTNGLEVAGTVVFIDDANIDGKTPANNAIKGKTTGFVDSYDSKVDGKEGPAVSGMADKYYTYNYSLKKVVTGAMGDKVHPFKFNIATTGVAGQKFTYVPAGGSNAEGVIATAVETTLSDGQTLEIKGLPANATINVTETNDTPDTYTVSANDEKAGVLIEETATAKNGANSTEAKAVSNYENETTVLEARLTNTTFTNNLNEVSPTNVVMRFAPYLFILGGAMLLLVASRRRKAEQE